MGLPEFILHRMLVPNSFRFDHSRFSFEIKNTYGAGTITHLKLIADGNDIPLDQIQYHADGQPAKLASQILPQSPAAIPTGIRISISIQASANPKNLVLWAETKEAGTIKLIVKNDKTLAMRKPTILSFLRKPLDFHLNIDLENSTPINDLLLGSNCDKDPNPNPGDSSSIHPLLLVFPPVIASTGYRWTDGVGPMPSRSIRHDLGWRPPQDNRFGTDEFLQYCQTSRIQPVLAVDSTLTTAEEAAFWVKYCNEPPPNSERIAPDLNGQPAPHTAKTWIISGNAWQDWELTATSAMTYARKISHFTQAMRAVDNELKIGILVKCLISDDPADPNVRWNEILLTHVGQNIDFVYWQIPILEDGFISEGSSNDNPAKVEASFSTNLESMLARMGSQISRCIQNRVIRQAIDASWFFDSLNAQIQNKSVKMDQIDRNIFLLEVMKSIIKRGEKVTFLTLGTKELQTSKLPPIQMFLAALSPGNRSSIVSMTISPNSALADPHSDAPELDGILISTPDKQQFELILANRTPDRRLRVELTPPNLGNFHLLKTSSTPSLLNNLMIKIRKISDAHQVILPPHSITCVLFEHSVKNS